MSSPAVTPTSSPTHPTASAEYIRIISPPKPRAHLATREVGKTFASAQAEVAEHAEGCRWFSDRTEEILDATHDADVLFSTVTAGPPRRDPPLPAKYFSQHELIGRMDVDVRR